MGWWRGWLRRALWRRLIVGAVRDGPLDYLTRPFHPVSCRRQLAAPGGLVKMCDGPVRALVHEQPGSGPVDMVVMVGSPSFLCEQTGMAGCAMVRAVAHGADSACGVVVVSAGSPQCPLPAPPRRTSAVWSRRRSRRLRRGNAMTVLYTASPWLCESAKKNSRPHRRQSPEGWHERPPPPPLGETMVRHAPSSQRHLTLRRRLCPPRPRPPRRSARRRAGGYI